MPLRYDALVTILNTLLVRKLYQPVYIAVQRFLSRFKLIHQFALIAAAFAMLSLCGGALIWMKINELQKANTKIIEAQFPSRLALAEAKGSAAAFANLAYRALNADADQLKEIKAAIVDEEQRFRHWLPYQK